MILLLEVLYKLVAKVQVILQNELAYQVLKSLVIQFSHWV